MVKYAIFIVLLGHLWSTALEHEPAPISLHLFNEVLGDAFLCKIDKYYLSRVTGEKQVISDIERYKKEVFNIFDRQSKTTNMRWDTNGSLDLNFADQKHEADPILTLVYYWDSQRNMLDLQWYKKYSDGQKLTLDPKVHTYVALVLRGENLQDSYFYYDNMPEAE